MIDLEEQDQYKEDWLGLKTMDQAGKLSFEVMEGEHVSPFVYFIIFFFPSLILILHAYRMKSSKCALIILSILCLEKDAIFVGGVRRKDYHPILAGNRRPR